jgi:hypothetical protein
MTTIRKGQPVTYRLPNGSVEAIVRTVHLDHTATIEARHFRNEKGEIEGGYLGYRSRVPVALLSPEDQAKERGL